MNNPTIFISYSWKPQTNKNKVIELAERLQLDGVHVIIDEWDLSEGQDKYVFMEQMVNRINVNRVLLICNKEYCDKANEKKGGVGIESLIVSDEIYKQVDQKKFIPVVVEKDETGNAYLPTFIKSRIYIDLSSNNTFEDEYEKLLRNIFERPSSKRPPLGTPPAYITTNEESVLLTAHKVSSIKSSLINERKNTQLLINEYYDTFIKSLDEYRFKDEDYQSKEPLDEIILRRIEQLRPLRDDFINLVETISVYSEQFNIEALHGFWQKIIEFIVEDDTNTHPVRSQYGYLIFDHFRFFVREIFLHQIALLIRKEDFKAINYLLYTPFVIYSSKRGDTRVYTYEAIRAYIECFENRNKRLGLNRISITADLLKERTANALVDFTEVQQADIALYYASLIGKEKLSTYGNNHWSWYPETTVYRNLAYPMFGRMASLRYFEKSRLMFGLASLEELNRKLPKAIELDDQTQGRFHYHIPRIAYILDSSKIGQLP